MKMIIGGAYQGKLDYARSLYPEIDWIDGNRCTREDIYHCGGIYHFEQYIRRQMEADENSGVTELAEQLAAKNQDLIIISREIGYGLVPVDRFERQYREQTGRICTKLAAYADRVDRVVCGIGHIIKGEETK